MPETDAVAAAVARAFPHLSERERLLRYAVGLLDVLLMWELSSAEASVGATKAGGACESLNGIEATRRWHTAAKARAEWLRTVRGDLAGLTAGAFPPEAGDGSDG